MRYVGFLAALIYLGQPVSAGTLSLVTLDYSVSISERYFTPGPELMDGRTGTGGAGLVVESQHSSARLDPENGTIRLKLSAADDIRASSASGNARIVLQNTGSDAVPLPPNFFGVSGSASIVRGGQVGSVVASGGYQSLASATEFWRGGASKGCRTTAFLECFESVVDANEVILSDKLTNTLLEGPAASYAYSRILERGFSLQPGFFIELDYGFVISLEERRNQSVPATTIVDGSNTLRFGLTLAEGTTLDVSRFPGYAPEWIRIAGTGAGTGDPGEVAVIPLPASAFLLLGALGAFALARRRAVSPT
jgi:hypothetical protein